VVLFGGAKSVTELFNDALIYFIKEKSWLKLEPSGDIPSARAAHAACGKDKDHIIIFGGANKNGSFASNELYMLALRPDRSKSKWTILNCKDPKPLRRYGHTMVYAKPYLVVFGGIQKEKNKLSNEVWVLNLDNRIIDSNKIHNQITIKVNDEIKVKPSESHEYFYEWKLVEFNNDSIIPSSRMYHSSVICRSGKAKGMILIFGGRADKRTPLNDLWGLRKHRNGSWEWILAPCSNKVTPLKRYQHSSICYSNNMIVLGGLSDLENIENGGIPVEIFNCDNLEWITYFHFNKFRHASVILEKYAFTFGGCELSNPLQPTDNFVMFDVQELCNNVTKYNI
jgi:protein phosphatase